jgi:LAO/AO transport system kinase
MLSLAHSHDAWNPPVLKVSALTGAGIDKLLAAIREHRAFLRSSGRLAIWPAKRARRRLLDGFHDRIVATVLAAIAPADFDRLVEDVAENRVTLAAGIDRLLQALEVFFRSPGGSIRTLSSERIHSIGRVQGR